jgi:hypothetical protein
MFSSWKTREECRHLRDSLEISSDTAALPAPLKQHLSACADCKAAADELLLGRALLRNMPPQLVEPGPWFASRVMAAITARESNQRRSQEAWTVVPKLAARLTWVSALAILLAGTWLYQSPNSVQRPGDENGFESLFDGPAGSPPQDDALISPEKANER